MSTDGACESRKPRFEVGVGEENRKKDPIILLIN